MKSTLKRVASLLMALIMILEVVTPGVVQARSNNDNRATVSEEEFVPGDAYVPSAQNQPQRQAPSSYRPQRQAPNTYQPSRPAQSAPGKAETSDETFDPAANKVEVSGEKAPKPLIEDEAKSKEMALEFAEEKERVRVASPMNPGGLEDKKFTILTRFDTSTVNGSVKKGQTFTLHLDDKLTVKDPSTLKRLSHNGKVITDPPVYDKDKNTITYTVKDDINENIQVPMAVDVDYNTKNIDPNAKKFTIINKVTGIGVKDPKELIPVVVDSNGNMLSSIIEPGRDDVIQVIQEGDNYKVNVDAYGEPIVKDREMKSIRWTVKITSDTDLKELGLKTNFTTVKGSGLGEIGTISATNVTVGPNDITDNDIKGSVGIVSSKHHSLNQTTKEIYYTFDTPVVNKQASYMLDLSAVLTAKNTKGAVRLVLPEGYSRDQIREITPTRVGMNNRSTVMGEFTSDKTATWTVTDAVSSKDPGTLPLEDRKLEGKQTLQAGGGNMAVYGIDAATGKMVQKGTTTSIGGFPVKGENPGAQDVGTIAVYELKTDLTNPNQAEDYAVSGVAISKYQDLYIKQVWGDMPDNIPMPAQKFTAKGTNGEDLGTWEVGEDTTSKTSRNITLPGAKYWDIDSKGAATRLEHKIEQDFGTLPKNINGKNYTYYENLNYYTKDEETDQKYHFIQNRAVETPIDKPGTFDVVKVDSKEPNKKLEGARFKLNGANAEATTDTDGKATFSNIAPGSYSLIETKAPDGYKLEQSPKNVIITANGDVSISGKNASFSGSKNKTELVDHNNYPNWPDYMNAMRYGKLEDGQLNFYLYLKPRAATENGSTDKDTRLNISIPGMSVTDVTAYDVSSDERADIRSAMENQTVDTEIGSLGDNVIGVANNNGKITGTPNVKDPYTGRTGYQIIFPKGRFANDWGFLVKVTVNVNKDKTSVPLYYDWLTNNKDTATETKLQQLVTVNAQNDGDTTPTVTIANEAFEKQSVSVTKVDKDKKGLPGATFVLKDKNGKPISDVDTDENGTANFDKLSAGKYIIEETKAPDGYIASSVVFDVTVAEDGQVTYTPRFKSGSGDPVQGTDYFIENGENSQGTGNVEYKISKNEMAIKENEPGDIGRRTGVWEAYCYESLKYSASIEVSSSKKGSRFSIQFDPNLDFKQYVNDMPKLKDKDGHVIADPYFDYTTNRLTYVFNGKYGEGRTTADINIRGIVPNKFYAKEDDTYHFETTIFPDVADAKIVAGLDKKTTGIDVQADYGRYDTNSATPAQSYYHRDIYTGSDGEEYFTVLAYYNPLADNNRSARTLRFNWLSTNFGGNNTQIVHWPANGSTPAFNLKNVKIYRTAPDKYWVGDKPINRNMPLSFGVRPEQDPNTYTLVYDKTIDDPKKKIDNETTNGFTLNYDPSQIQSWGTLNQNGPLKIGMPGISRGNEGYIIEQTFKVNNKDKWYNLFRAFYMNNGVLESAFASKVNKNKGTADQTTQEIPKFYEQKVKLVNQKYTAGEFSIYKYDETNYNHMLPGATFALTNDKDQTIYRTTGADGTLSFTNLPPGNYSLVETKAPGSYVKSDKNWQVTVSNTGKVTITELSLAGSTIAGNKIKLDVPNKPVGKKFRVYKKDGNGKPLEGATFTITKKGETKAFATAKSNEDGLVEFDKLLIKGNTYILKETNPPTGYKPLNQKWVVVVDQDNKAKVYNYVEGGTSNNKTKGLAAEEGTYWVDVAHRPLTGWNLYDNRRTGYVDNYPFPYKMGTRIIAKNVKDEDNKYVIQRFIINPEENQIPAGSKVQIHREKPAYTNMDWYNGSATIKAFTLDKAVTEKTVEEFRLTNYTATEINLTQTPVKRDSEPDRLEMDLPKTDKPIVIDVKLPYTSEDGGVGLGMDYITKANGVDVTYWKSDYYEKASSIVLGEAVPTDNESDIVGAYVSEDSLDVTNELKKYSFKLKKVKEGDTNTTIQGATFSLKGPGENGEERTLVTDEKGIIQFDDLVEGTYKLEETSPASGYDKVTTTWTVTITKKGKVFMKDDGATGKSDMWGVAQDTSSPAHQMSRSAQLDNFLTTFGGSESSLGLGPDLMRDPVRADADWQDIDPKRSENLTQKRVLAQDNGAPANTKITEINKKDKRFRQSFLYVQGPYGDKPREIQIHREPLSYDLLKEKTNIRVYQVKGSEIGSLTKTNEITGKITFTKKRAKDTEPYRLVATIPSSYKGSILVEVETNYDAQYGIGLGSNYNSNTIAQYDNKSWVADSYASEAGINKSVITYETGWEFDSVIEKPATIDVPEVDKFEDETWTVQGNTGKLFKEYRYTLKDGVRTGEKVATGNTKEDPAAKADEYHHGTKKRPVVPSERTSAVISLTKDIPFKEIITEDPNLEANTRVVDVAGENGQEEWNYSITYDRKNEPDAVKPADWPQGAPQPEKQEGERIASYNAVFVKTTKQAKDQQVRVGSKETSNPGTEIPTGSMALIKNKQTGLDVKIFKRNSMGTGLKDAIFTLKETESDYKTEKPNGLNLTAMSDDEGRLIIIDNAKDKKPLDPQPKIKAGYYVLKEDTAPVGYKKITAPWNIHVREDKNGQLVADYFGPEDTASSYLNHVRMEDGKLVDKAMVNELTSRNSGIKYASRVVSIDPEAKTFRQRLYLDTRDTNQVINVQINPVNKRDERDFVPDENGAKPPKTLAEGVKTAYRTTYKLANPGTITKEKANEILKSYDLSKPGVSMVNTARWRPFDWGFDEDQLNLEPGVYFIDVEGYYDDNIVNGDKDNNVDKGKIKVKFDFFSGERQFMQVIKDNNGGLTWQTGGSYQAGNEAGGFGKETQWGKLQDTENNQKYPNWLSKVVRWNGYEYRYGKISPAIEEGSEGYVPPLDTFETGIDINPLYTSSKTRSIPESGMIITDEEESYNITFSKHGKDGDDESWNNGGEKVANNRLEGAVFKLQQYTPTSNNFEDVKGTYVASAFNGYFGFRGLKPGRYRLMEVKAPEGYTPIKEAILYMTIAYKDGEPDKDTGNITPGKGQITLEYNKNANGIIQYVDTKNKPVNAPLVDFVTSGTAKNMGKIVNTKPGKGNVTISKFDEKGNPLLGSVEGELKIGAKFRLTRLSLDGKTDAEGKNEGVWIGTVGEDGKLNFPDLGIGNYRLEEISPHPGHINTRMVWNFTVGGKDIDPYAEDTNKPTRNITDSIKLDKSDVKVQKYMGKDNTRVDDNIYPHKAQSVSILSDFSLKDKTLTIQPGDYFTVKVSDSIDLLGIYKNRTVANLNIFADGVGTIAKGTYNKRDNTITYTFTDYAKTYSLENFKTQLVAWIDLERIKEDKKNVPVGIGLGGKDLPDDKLQTKPLNVYYDIEKETSSHPDYKKSRFNQNITGKIYELNPKTGEFVQYYYINRQRHDGRYMPKFRFYANQYLYDVHISIDKLKDNTKDLNTWMPASFAVPAFNNDGLTPIERYDRNWISEYWYNFSNTPDEGMGEDDSYIVTVRGKVNPETAKELHTYGDLLLYNSYGYEFGRVSREDWAYFDENKTEAKAALSIRAVNPKNKVVFEKVDADGKPLEGAKFTLYKKNKDTDKYETGGNDTHVSGKDGLITFEGLAPGEYRITETEEPDSYVINKDVLLEFTVNEDGKIIKKVNDAEGKPVEQVEDGNVPIRVVNHKPVVFTKVDGLEGNALQGAEFEVWYKKTKDALKYLPYVVKDANGKDKTLTVTSSKDGKIKLELYKSGYYALKETKAPKDYIKPSPMSGYVKEFVIQDDGILIKEPVLVQGTRQGDPTQDGNQAIDMYFVVNPYHKKMTDSATFTMDLPKDGSVKEDGITVYALDSGDKIADGKKLNKPADFNSKTENGKLTVTLPKPTVNEGKESGKAKKKLVIKVPMTVKGKGEVTIPTATTFNGTTTDANYRFDPEALDKSSTDDPFTNAKNSPIYREYRTAETTDDKTTNPASYDIENTKGTYPFTGGFGPNRWIVIIGAIIAAIAAEEYIRRKRSSAEPKGGA